jgi:hypothetical protein
MTTPASDGPGTERVIPFSEVPVGSMFSISTMPHRILQKHKYACTTEAMNLVTLRPEIPCIVRQEVQHE